MEGSYSAESLSTFSSGLPTWTDNQGEVFSTKIQLRLFVFASVMDN